MRTLGSMLGAVLLAASSCAPDPGVQELVRELRAERLARRDATQASTRKVAEDVMAATVAPLQAALNELLERQGELTLRQSQLASELREWTRFTVDTQQREQSARAAELTERLHELEAALAAQAEKHGEVEAAFGEALEQATERLRALLRRLGVEAGPPAVPPAAPPGAPPAGRPGASAGDGAAGGARGTGGERQGSGDADGRDGGRDGGDGERTQTASLWPMWSVAVMAFGAGAWLLVPRRPQPLPAAPDGAPTSALASQGATPATPPGAPRTTAAAPPPARWPLPADEALGGKAGVERVSVGLRASSARAEQQIRELLSRDARVLKEPAPELSRRGDGLTVTYALLPGVLAGERGRLEQRLRDATR